MQPGNMNTNGKPKEPDINLLLPDLEPVYQRINEMARGSLMLQAALMTGAKVDVTFHIAGGQVKDRGPFVTVEEVV
jgi:hypothetical protein